MHQCQNAGASRMLPHYSPWLGPNIVTRRRKGWFDCRASQAVNPRNFADGAFIALRNVITMYVH